MIRQPGGSGVNGEVLYSLCGRCGHDRFDAVDCEHGQECPMPKGSRMHEECVGCPFEKVDPQPCNGHILGPSACGDRPRLVSLRDRLAQHDLENAPAPDDGLPVLARSIPAPMEDA
jgi:hypothetical protein